MGAEKSGNRQRMVEQEVQEVSRGRWTCVVDILHARVLLA